MIRWIDCTAEDSALIERIVDRTWKRVYSACSIEEGRHTAEMDLMACHVSGCPLDLKAMAETDSMQDLMHDVAGIRRHIDRRNGKLGDCFVPRFALRQIPA